MDKLNAIVLAAGRGTRMLSSCPKVLHSLLDRPILSYPLQTLSELKVKRRLVVVGEDEVGDQVVEALAYESGLEWPRQASPRGTADAVAAALPLLAAERGTVLIVCGDVPLLRPETLKAFYLQHQIKQAKLSVLTAVLDKGGSYGRVMLDGRGRPEAIIEARDASPEQLACTRINSGTYLVDLDLLRRALAATDCRNAQGEYYLTDMVAFARSRDEATAIFDIDDVREILGINTRADLVALEKIMARRLVDVWLARGVTIHLPETVRSGSLVRIGPDTEIDAGVTMFGRTEIGKNCRIGVGAWIQDCCLADQVEIKPYSVLEQARIDHGSAIGPFARLRPGTEIGPDAKIGNFVETKKARFGRGAKASHLAYIGDAEVGDESNLGAGTITCNYDGFKKFRTEIGCRVFIGSDSQLVAPVKIGDDALIGAGSTVTREVSANALVTTRVRQKELAGRGMAQRRKALTED
ncbi:MAG: bifunctional UDP-N-acetylglucosamine diphosphorylase/glucosamine-1-phosphate N-acetyltransferase GlmU [Deltaproteobacteria bacterium]|nr:bifunctional UDP-N-acetylglucosamine diphosphorylase/glucosamine-1-phosphate N-acetyltransferase GlmU [Deltaproteobacteria bacterium]